MMAPRAKQNSSIQNAAKNPRQAPPCLDRVSRPRVPAKVKAQADAGGMDRTRTARKELQVLNAKCALKGAELHPSAPGLRQRNARLREKHSPELFRGEKLRHALARFIRSREHLNKRGRGLCGILVRPEGCGQQRGR